MLEISEDQRADVAVLVDYLWDDERDDYEACANGSGNENGIFPRLVRLRNWIDGTDATPESFVKLDEDR
jgi:hypothetical protein